MAGKGPAKVRAVTAFAARLETVRVPTRREDAEGGSYALPWEHLPRRLAALFTTSEPSALLSLATAEAAAALFKSAASQLP